MMIVTKHERDPNHPNTGGTGSGIHYHLPSLARGQQALLDAAAAAAEASRGKETPPPVLVLAPTHRSYLDFVLLVCKVDLFVWWLR